MKMNLKKILNIFLYISIVTAYDCDYVYEEIESDCTCIEKDGEVSLLSIENKDYSKGIPEEIFNLTSLLHLSLKNCKITSIPSEIKNLENVLYMDFSGNKLTNIPKEMKDLKKLMSLFLDNNLIRNFSDEIIDLLKTSKQIDLYLKDNQIKSFPDDLSSSYYNAVFLINNCFDQKPEDNGIIQRGNLTVYEINNSPSFCKYDDRCGENFGECRDSQCCSSKGYCGTSSAYCSLSKGCQINYGECEDDTKNDDNANEKNSDDEEENNNKNADEEKNDNDSVNEDENDNNEENRCGEGIGVCPDGQCCSKYGYCGTVSSYCSLSNGCQIKFGVCEDNATEEKSDNKNTDNDSNDNDNADEEKSDDDNADKEKSDDDNADKEKSDDDNADKEKSDDDNADEDSDDNECNLKDLRNINGQCSSRFEGCEFLECTVIPNEDYIKICEQKYNNKEIDDNDYLWFMNYLEDIKQREEKCYGSDVEEESNSNSSTSNFNSGTSCSSNSGTSNSDTSSSNSDTSSSNSGTSSSNSGTSNSNSGTSNSGTSNSGTSNSGTSNSGTSNSGTSNSGTSNSGTSNSSNKLSNNIKNADTSDASKLTYSILAIVAVIFNILL